MENLLSEIEECLARTQGKISPTKFGEMAMGDRHLVRQLRNGREVRSKTVNKVRALISSLNQQDQATRSEESSVD